MEKQIFNKLKYNTWIYCKGITYKDVLLILTKNTEFIVNKSKPKNTFKSQTRNCLYVALIRASNNLYLVTKYAWDKLNNNQFLSGRIPRSFSN